MTILIVYILFYLLHVWMNLIKITNIFITEILKFGGHLYIFDS